MNQGLNFTEVMTLTSMSHLKGRFGVLYMIKHVCISNKTYQYAVAINNRGEFLALHKTFGATSPYTVEHPHEAEQIRIDPTNIPFKFKPATHYFENSERMRMWLKVFSMVVVFEDSTAEYLDER